MLKQGLIALAIAAAPLAAAQAQAPDFAAAVSAPGRPEAAVALDEVRRRLPGTQVLLLGMLPSVRSEWVTRTTAEVNRGLAARYYWASLRGRLDGFRARGAAEGLPLPPLQPAVAGQG